MQLGLGGGAQLASARVDGTSNRRRAARLGHVTVAHSLRGKHVLRRRCRRSANSSAVADRLGLDLDNLALFHRSRRCATTTTVDAGMLLRRVLLARSRGRGGRYYAYCAWCPGWTVRNPARLALISLIGGVVRPARAGAHPPQRRVHVLHLARRRPDRASLMGYVTAAPVVELFFNIAFTIERSSSSPRGRRPRQVRVPQDGGTARRPRRRQLICRTASRMPAAPSTSRHIDHSVRVLRPLRTITGSRIACSCARCCLAAGERAHMGRAPPAPPPPPRLLTLSHSLPQLATVAMLLLHVPCFGIGASGSSRRRPAPAARRRRRVRRAVRARRRRRLPAPPGHVRSAGDGRCSCLPIWADARSTSLITTRRSAHGSDYPPSMCDEGLQV